jgi:riboflavin kinase / FMN adenylyltransferase
MVGSIISNMMLLITDLGDLPSFSQPCGLTIGSFDGVHIGHQALLKHLKSKLPSNGVLAVFTFLNHPTHLFTPHHLTRLICPPLQKVKHLADYGANIVCLIPFTSEFAKTSFREFLLHLKKQLNFSYLALGTGATFGKNKEGNEANVRKLASELAFNVDYIPKTLVKGIPVSSGRIRSSIAQGALHEVQEYLGRHYSLMGRLQRENGFSHFFLPGICLPPEGIYPVRIKTNFTIYLGRAQVLPKEQLIRLDLLETTISLQDKDIEVIF